MENSTIAVHVPQIRPAAVPGMKNLRFRAAVLAVAVGILGAELIPVHGIRTVKIENDVPGTEKMTDRKIVPGTVEETGNRMILDGMGLTGKVKLPGCTDLKECVVFPESTDLEAGRPFLESAGLTENVMFPECMEIPGDVTVPECMEIPGDVTVHGSEETKDHGILPEQGGLPGDVICPESEGPAAGVVLPEYENTDGETGENGIVPENEDAADNVPGSGEEHASGNPAAVSGFLIDSEGMICGVDASSVAVEDGYLELPAEGCSGIRRGAFTGTTAGIVEIYIPSNIVTVEEGAFSGLCQLEWIEVAGDNAGCMSTDGVLLDGSGTTLLAFPGGRTDRYSVPESVTRIADGAFADTCISGLDFWLCGPVEIGTGIFGSHNGNGMEIKVPAEYADWYQNHFTGYDVQIL